MSQRTIGGGRVLGSGRSLTPNAAAAAAASPKGKARAAGGGRAPSTPRPSGPLSPAPSRQSAASGSQQSPSAARTPFNGSEDLQSRISTPRQFNLNHNANANATESRLNGSGNGSGESSGVAGSPAGSRVGGEGASRLACPICDEEMVTLLQLNRHIDDVHQNLEEERQVEVKDWFQIQVDKAKRLRSLAVLGQKLKGKEVFEPNSNANAALSISPAAQSASHARSLSGDSSRFVANTTSTPSAATTTADPSELVTRNHWQPRTFNDYCADPACAKRLTATTGAVHCRRCGRLFCEEHTMYQMKLSQSAQHEPVRGVWCRVCETCYKSREGYSDHRGAHRDLSAAFSAARKPTVAKAFLEVSRLEKRLSRLTSQLARLPTEPQSRHWPPWRDDERKQIEQSVVPWEDDAAVPRCPFCQQEFATYTFRRHHCRVCGRVVCGDPATRCSLPEPLAVAVDSPITTASGRAIPATRTVSIDVRLCRACRATLFARRDFERAAAPDPPPPALRAYRTMRQFEAGIRALLPRFQNLLAALQDPDRPPSPEQLAEAAKVRRRLVDAFAKLDAAARRIRDLPTDSPTQAKLQAAIHMQASNFLHLHMLPLKSLPRLLKHATPHGAADVSDGSPASSTSGGTPTTGARRVLALIRGGDGAGGASPDSIASGNSSAISALETEEKQLREQLAVLEEQRFLVSEMVADANRRRKFDEAASLAGNADDLRQEIERVSARIGELDFQSLYTSPLAQSQRQPNS